MEKSLQHTRLAMPPLHRMICQLRFPQLLSIGDPEIREIQKAFAENYPNASRASIVIRAEINSAGKISTESSDLYRFEAEDGTAINLTDQTISYETARYSRFHGFAKSWEEIARVVSDKLGIQRQNRLGLRYTNILKRQGVNAMEDWRGQIAPHLLIAETSINEAFDASASLSQHQIRFRIPNGTAIFRYGSSDIPEDPNLPEGYLIDIDSADDVPKVIDWEHQMLVLAAWNHFTYKLLRMSVTEEAWASFQPEEL